MGENHFKVSLGAAPGHPDWPNLLQFTILRNAKGNALQLDVVFTGGTGYSFNEYFQSYSYDGVNWRPVDWKLGHRMSKQEDSITFPVFEKNRVYVGRQVPLSFEHIESFIKKWRKTPHVTVHVIGKSLERRNLYRIEITDANSPHPRDERWVHWFANQHPGEHNSQWRMVGMIEWLLSDEGADCRRRFICHFNPMMSPDAPSHGWYRINAQGVDMNRAYRAEGSDKDAQAHEAYLYQRDLESLFASTEPPTSLWCMHTWSGNVDPRILPGPEMAPLGGWETLRDLINRHNHADLVRPMAKWVVKPETRTYWTDGMHVQFGATSVLCEGGAIIKTKEANKESGVVLMKGLAEYYRGTRP
ncbi:hypothetical protein HS125_13375 [bacterium]|nr:hypothetical protein [bacterium]